MNNVTIYGRLTRDFVLGETAGGTACARGGIASRSRTRKNGDGTAATDFFDVVAYGKCAVAMADYLYKGQRVVISGEVSIRDYDRDDGTRGRAVCVTVSGFDFVETAADAEDEGEDGEEEAPAPAGRAKAPQKPAGKPAARPARWTR